MASFNSIAIVLVALSSQIFGHNNQTNISPTGSQHLSNVTTSNNATGQGENDSAISAIDSRIGLVYQKASASGTSDEGGESAAEQESLAVGAGIEGADGSYSAIAGHAKTWGSTSVGGYNAPNTWAQTSANVDQGEASGSANAGIDGGEGTAETDGYASNERYPIGFGQTLYSNLHLNVSHSAKNVSSSTNQTKSGNQTQSARKIDLKRKKFDVLVLH